MSWCHRFESAPIRKRFMSCLVLCTEIEKLTGTLIYEINKHNDHLRV